MQKKAREKVFIGLFFIILLFLLFTRGKQVEEQKKTTNNDKDELRFQRRKGKIRVRIYRVGFGDCFLVSLPSVQATTSTTTRGARDEARIEKEDDEDELTNDKNYAYHILIDFGVATGGYIGTLQEVIRNISDVTDRKLAVIIATHAHRDHIYGFGKFKEDFQSSRSERYGCPGLGMTTIKML